MIWFGWVLWHNNHCRLFNAKSSLYIYIKYIWYGLVGFLWHVNHCRLFNDKSSLSIYIRYIWFDLVGFYGISTIVSYLIPSPLCTNISNMIVKHILLITFMIAPNLILLLTGKWLQVLLCTTNNSIKHQSFVYTQLNVRVVLCQTI